MFVSAMFDKSNASQILARDYIGKNIFIIQTKEENFPSPAI